MSTILIADRLPVIRAALRSMLERAGHEVIGEADNGPDALSLSRERKPALVISELAIPRLGGLDLIRRLKSGQTGTKILIYSSHESGLYASRCLQAGADAYVSKIDALEDLEAAITSVLHGHSYFPSSATQSFDFAATAEPREHAVEQLSARELTVLQLLARGLTNQQIADQLSLSYKTVSTYKVRLQHKLNVDSTFQLLELARTTGLVSVGVDRSTVAMDLLPGAELEKEYRMLHALVNAMPVSMVVRDLEGRVLMCNNRFLERVGARNFDEVRGLKLEDSFWFSRALRERLARRYQEVIENEEPVSAEAVIDEHGRQQPVAVWGVPYRDAQGKVIGMLLGTRNLARRDAMLTELRHDKAEVESKSRMKSEALSAVSLEFYPLLKLMGSLLTVANELHDVEQIHEATRNAAYVLNDMQKALDRVDQLIDLDSLQVTPVIEVRHLGELTVEILQPLREWLQEQGGALSIQQHELVLKEAWIDVAHYAEMLESLVWQLGRGQPRRPIVLRLQSDVLPGGFMKFTLQVGAVNGGENGELAGLHDNGLDSVHFRHLLEVLGARIRRESAGSHGEGSWIVELTLPLTRTAT